MKATLGEPPNDNGTCPRCGNEDLDTGYGMAYGGMGMYTYCSMNDCEWFFKVMDPEMYPEGFEQ